MTLDNVYKANYVLKNVVRRTDVLYAPKLKPGTELYLKQRICSDEGHLNNEDCAEALAHFIDLNTKLVVLAHISQQANTRELALHTVVERLQEEKDRCRKDLMICAAGQFEMILKGEDDEEMDLGTVNSSVHLEYRTDNYADF